MNLSSHGMAFKSHLPGFRAQYQAVKNPVFSLTENKAANEDQISYTTTSPLVLKIIYIFNMYSEAHNCLECPLLKFYIFIAGLRSIFSDLNFWPTSCRPCVGLAYISTSCTQHSLVSLK